eukprot:6175756-Pleurochrysis_carterae.AAC.1
MALPSCKGCCSFHLRALNQSKYDRVLLPDQRRSDGSKTEGIGQLRLLVVRWLLRHRSVIPRAARSRRGRAATAPYPAHARRIARGNDETIVEKPRNGRHHRRLFYILQ